MTSPSSSEYLFDEESAHISQNEQNEMNADAENLRRLCICGDPNCAILYGTCHCTCGKATTISHCTDRYHGWAKGTPHLFLPGHCNIIRPVIEEALPFKIEGVYCRLIPLSRGLYAIVDESDYRWLMQWKWNARWDKSVNGFYAVRTDPEHGTIQMHRQILGLEKGNKTKTDHASKCTIDNRRDNLRPASNQQSSQNQGRRSDNTSGYKGVSRHSQTGKWLARIVIDGRRRSLGLFEIKEDAYDAYCAAAKRYYGEFASLV